MRNILLMLIMAVSLSCSAKGTQLTITLISERELPVVISDNGEVTLEPNSEGKYVYEFKDNDHLISWVFIGEWNCQFYLEKGHDLEITVEVGYDEKGNINAIAVPYVTPYYEKTYEYLLSHGSPLSLIEGDDFAMKEMDFYKACQDIVTNFQNNLKNLDLPDKFKELEHEKIKYELLKVLVDHEIGYEFMNKINPEEYAMSDAYKELVLSGYEDKEVLTGIMHSYWMSLNMLFEKTLKLGGETLEENLILRIQKCKEMIKNPKLLDRVIFCEFAKYLSYNFAKPNKELIALGNEIKNKKLKKRFAELIDQKNKIKKGKKAFNFSCKDVNGKEYKLSDFKGKLVVLDIWATWCKPCMQGLPHFLKKQKEYNTKPVHFITLSVDKKVDAWKKKVEELGMTKNAFIATGSKALMKSFGLMGIPASIIIDEDGYILDGHAPRAEDPLYDATINSYLNKK